MQIYDALRKDHLRIKVLLSELIQLQDTESHHRRELVQRVRDELIPHSRAEEAVLYNSLRLIETARDIAGQGSDEHTEAERLLRILQLKDRIDADWKETAIQLRSSMEHHMLDEEERVFSAAQQLFTNDESETMAEVYEKLKAEVRNQGFLKSTVDTIAHLLPARFARHGDRARA